MSEVSPVKLRLATSLLELLKGRALEKITVADITKNAGLSLRTFYNHFHDKYELVSFAYRDGVDKLWMDGEKVRSLEDFFRVSWGNEDTMAVFTLRNVLLYYGQNSLREEIERKGVEDLSRLLKLNGYPGEIDEEVRNILLFYMCGITRISELYCQNAAGISSEWLNTYGVKCIPAPIADYLVLDPNSAENDQK